MVRKFEGENFHHLLISIYINIQNSVMGTKIKNQLGVFAVVITITTITMIIINLAKF